MTTATEVFNYDESVLNAIQTAKAYEKRLSLEDITTRGVIDKQFAEGWGNYMRTRRSGSFYHYAVQQKQEIHELAFLTLDGAVCTCGLIVSKPSEDDDATALLLQSSGHIHSVTRNPVSLYVVTIWHSKAEGRRQHYWCESCGDIGAAIPTETGKVSLIGLKAIRKSHKCSVAK